MVPRRGFPAPTRVARAVLLGLLAAAGGTAGAQPAGLQVMSGGAVLSRTGTQLTVTTTNNAAGHSVLHWQSFSVPAGTTTRIEQPSVSSLSINRVVGETPSAILGTLSSNGRLALVNPAGIAVGPNAVVDTAGFTASTLRMTDAEILAGRTRVADAAPGGALDIQGRVIARHGDVFLLGGPLRHTGHVQATSAQIDGGRVVLQAQGEARVAGTVVARRIDGAGGGERGGAIDVLGERVVLEAGARLDASGAQGGGQVRVGGDFQGANPEVPNARTTRLDAQARIEADATVQGDGGRIIVWSDDTTASHGAISARGGPLGGNGGFVEVSGRQQLQFSSVVDTRAPAGRRGTLLLDPADIVVGSPDAGYTAVSELADATSPGAMQVSPAVLEAQASDIVLQASNDIVFAEALSLSGPGGAAASLTAEAGNRVRVQASLQATGAITLQGQAGVSVEGVAVTAGEGLRLQAPAGTVTVYGGSTLTAGAGLQILGNSLATANTGVAIFGASVIRAGTVLPASDVVIEGASGDNASQGVLLQGGSGIDLSAGSAGQVRITGTGSDQGTGVAITGRLLGTGALVVTGALDAAVAGGVPAGDPLGIALQDAIVGAAGVARAITLQSPQHAVRISSSQLRSGGAPLVITASDQGSANSQLDGLALFDVTLDATSPSGTSAEGTVEVLAVTRQLSSTSARPGLSLRGAIDLRADVRVNLLGRADGVPGAGDLATLGLAVGVDTSTTVSATGLVTLWGSAAWGTGTVADRATFDVAAGGDFTLVGESAHRGAYALDLGPVSGVTFNGSGAAVTLFGTNLATRGSLPATGGGVRIGQVSAGADTVAVIGQAAQGASMAGASGHLLQARGALTLQAQGGSIGTAAEPLRLDLDLDPFQPGTLTTRTTADRGDVHLQAVSPTLTVASLEVEGDATLRGAGAAPATTLLALRRARVTGQLVVEDFAETDLGAGLSNFVVAAGMDVAGHATVKGGLSPGGNGIGTMVFRNGLRVEAGAGLQFNFDGSGASVAHDRVLVTGALEFADPDVASQRPVVAVVATGATGWTLPAGTYTLMTGTTDTSGATPLPNLMVASPQTVPRLTLAYGSLLALVPPAMVVPPVAPPAPVTPPPVPDPLLPEPPPLGLALDAPQAAHRDVVMSSRSCRRA